MNSNNLQKSLREEKESVSAEDPFAGEKAPLETGREQFTSQEIEKYRQDVIKGVEAEELPAKRPPPPQPAPAVQIAPVQKSLQLKQIENILEEDLRDAYYRLEPAVQRKFKTEGEKTAARIEELLAAAKVKTNKIFKLIFKWLKIIPGLNKYFLRQEAKIKADKIIKLK